MAEEARVILRVAFCEEHGPTCDLATAIRRRLAPFGGVERRPSSATPCASRQRSIPDRRDSPAPRAQPSVSLLELAHPSAPSARPRSAVSAAMG
jgi:hypothetical protein